MSREIAPSLATLQTNDPSLDTVIPSLDGSTTAPPVSAYPEAVWYELPDGTTKATMTIGTNIYSAVFSNNYSYTARTRYPVVQGGRTTIQVFLSTHGSEPLSAEVSGFADGKTSIVTLHVNDQHLEAVYVRPTHGDLEAGAVASSRSTSMRFMWKANLRLTWETCCVFKSAFTLRKSVRSLCRISHGDRSKRVILRER